MSNSSSFEDFLESSNEDSIVKRIEVISVNSKESSDEVTSPIPNTVVVIEVALVKNNPEAEEQKGSSLRPGYQWVHYEVREKFSDFW